MSRRRNSVSEYKQITEKLEQVTDDVARLGIELLVFYSTNLIFKVVVGFFKSIRNMD